MSERRLLVVDDELEFRQFLILFAAYLGYETAEANDFESFKRIYLDFDPTVIILDVIMPQMDGVDLLTWLMAQDCQAKIVVVTGSDTVERRMARVIEEDAGAQDIETFGKPIRLEDLRRNLS